MVQVLTPIDPLSLKPRTSSFRCSPLTRRRTLPSSRDLSFSQSWRQNALERVAVRKIAVKPVASSHIAKLEPFSSVSSQPTVIPASSTLVAPPSFTPAPSAQAGDILVQEVPSTPPTPLEVGIEIEEEKPKANIFNNTSSSDALLDLTLAALHRIYIDDYSDASWPSVSQPTFAAKVPSWPRPEANDYDQSPPSMSSSSVSSANSTPSSVSTPLHLSPTFEPEIAYQTDPGLQVADLHAAKPVGRTQSLPNNARLAQPACPTLGDKDTLRWFLVELLRRSRASAKTVQLALHYLAQARGPVGDILRRKFKGQARDRTGDEEKTAEEDSPLLDPRRLLLAALMLSTKLLHDHAPNNRAWARVCGLGARDVGACERALGQALDWKLATMLVGPAGLV